eukprot:414991_1
MTLIILSLFLNLIEIECVPNETYATTEEAPSSFTTMYTTGSQSTLVDVTSVSNTTDDVTCLFNVASTIQNSEGIDFIICGYEANDDDKIAMVDITLQLPQDRWVGVGFVLNDDYDAQS